MLFYLLIKSGLFFATPLYHVLCWWRRQKNKEHKSRYKERFGIPSQALNSPPVWFHAVSVGEVRSIIPVICEYKKKNPTVPILLTTGTLTSFSIVERELLHLVTHQFIPFDHPLYMKRFLQHWRPSVCYLVDSEIWPCLVFELSYKRTPIIILNARMSQKSFARWKKFQFLSSSIFKRLTVVFSPSSLTQRHFQRLGAKKTYLSPNIKLFASQTPISEKDFFYLNYLFQNTPTWVAASTHEGEESFFLDVHASLKQTIPNLVLFLTPRHPERARSLVNLCKQRNLSYSFYSASKMSDVLIVDTIGKLGTIFSLSKVVVMGGSFIPHGGHNPVEAWLHGCTVFFGPHMENFEDILDSLDAHKLSVSTQTELRHYLLESLLNKKKYTHDITQKITHIRAQLTPFVQDIIIGSPR